MLLRQGNKFVEKHNLEKLRVIGTVGEPINVAAWTWLHEIVGRGKCDIVRVLHGGTFFMPFCGNSIINSVDPS